MFMKASTHGFTPSVEVWQWIRSEKIESEKIACYDNDFIIAQIADVSASANGRRMSIVCGWRKAKKSKNIKRWRILIHEEMLTLWIYWNECSLARA